MTSLRSRLNTLKQQVGGAAARTPDTPPLRQRLQRLTVSRPSRPHQTRCSDAELAALLGGVRTADGLIVLEELVPAGTAHGHYGVGPDADGALATLGHQGGGGAVLFLDTETTGLAGGTGTLVFLLGLARLTQEGLRLRQYLLTGFGGEQPLLDSAAEFVHGTRTLVSFNGKGFDSPLLATRYRLATIADPFAGMAHVDLLHATRRAFASRWTDCRLQTAERRLLGFHRVDDLPGSRVPDAWFSWVRWGVTEALPKVLAHNRWDLVSLAALLSALAQCYAQPAERDADVLAVARHYLHRGDVERAHELLTENTARLSADGLLALALLCRRQGDWDRALAIWRALAEDNHPEALERLAKYYEHTARDFDQAIAFTRRLQALQPDTLTHRRRKARLAAKQAAATAPGPE